MKSSYRSNSNQSKGFDRLAEPVRRWVWNKGWSSLYDIQEYAIEVLLEDDRDVIIAAATAGGKTEAVFLPLVSTILDSPGDSGFDIVYVSPLRALINDQFERLEDLCSKTHLPVHPWHGDISQVAKSRARKNPKGILLITPESLEALFILRGLEIPTLFMSTRAIVIDELHALLDNERGVHVRSLLSRMELATGRRIRRIGLSATLGEMNLAREYLRPKAPEDIVLLESNSENQELQVQIRGYLRQDTRTKGDKQNEPEMAAQRKVTSHLFSKLRGSQNLIFAGSRQNVEWYADALREMSERAHLPQEFFPHHASLSREFRTDLEKRLKSHLATTAVCTSTLELGIDIGDIACVAQIGPPFSVSSLRQRLGRSGRRADQPAVLRMYAIETDTSADSHPLDRLHLDLIRSIAMVELLVEKWCEPPSGQALHLSTLTHQILSVIAAKGGASARNLYVTLCVQGPFQKVNQQLFTQLLRQLGLPEIALIEQSSDGTLLLGRKGERLVEHFSFYAVFQTPDEYRIVADGKQLGVLPISKVLVPDMTIIFSGRRWRIAKISDAEKVVEVTADPTGKPPNFGGGGGVIHDKVVEKMREVLTGTNIPLYLDETAACILNNARSEVRTLKVARELIYQMGSRHYLIATWAGTIKTSSLALALQSMGFSTETYDGFLEVRYGEKVEPIETALAKLASSASFRPESTLVEEGTFHTEKFHSYLSPELLRKDAFSSRIDLENLPKLARTIIGKGDSDKCSLHQSTKKVEVSGG